MNSFPKPAQIWIRVMICTLTLFNLAFVPDMFAGHKEKVATLKIVFCDSCSFGLNEKQLFRQKIEEEFANFATTTGKIRYVPVNELNKMTARKGIHLDGLNSGGDYSHAVRKLGLDAGIVVNIDRLGNYLEVIWRRFDWDSEKARIHSEASITTAERDIMITSIISKSLNNIAFKPTKFESITVWSGIGVFFGVTGYLNIFQKDHPTIIKYPRPPRLDDIKR